MTSRSYVQDAITRLAAAQTIAANSTVAFDFGTPNDIDLRDFGNPGDRVMILLTANRAAGTTSTLALVVQDAPDNAGAIGTPATATVKGTNTAIAAADAGLSTRCVSLVIQEGRPWLRVSLTHAGGGTDSFQAHCSVLMVPKVL